jgi:hypothetical protein
VITVVEE